MYEFITGGLVIRSQGVTVIRSSRLFCTKVKSIFLLSMFFRKKIFEIMSFYTFFWMKTPIFIYLKSLVHISWVLELPSSGTAWYLYLCQFYSYGFNIQYFDFLILT